MDLKLIHRLIRMMDRGEVSELEIDDEQAGLRIRLRRGAIPHGTAPVVSLVHGAAAAPLGGLAAPATSHSPGAEAGLGGAPGAAGAAAAGAASAAGRGELVEIESPMVGTFYRSSSPDAEPFVDTGQSVDEETVVCIIEAMKVMNEIKAETRGQIVEILVENGEPVEFGQPLFLVKPG